jgi:uncharacterized membrane protein YeaQ/YmgE (transglycosylase-associated protein family)
VIGFIISIFIIGMISGYLARLLVIGPDPMTFWQTVGLGLVGSLIGGIVGSLIFVGRLIVAPGGIVLSVLGSMIALLIWRKIKYGTTMPPPRQ